MHLAEFYEKYKAKIYLICNIAILFAMALFMCLTCSRQGLWIDEIKWTMGFMNNGFFNMIKELATSIYNLPVFYIVGFVFYRIFPANEIFIMLPSIISVVVGVWFLYLTIKNLYGYELATLVSFTSSISLALISFAGVQFRPYGLLFMLVCLCLYFYCRRLKDPSIKNFIILGVLFLLLVYTHWFGILFVGVLGVYDFILCCLKKQSFYVLLPYVVAVVLFIPWFIYAVLNSKYSLTEYWAEKPTITYPLSVISIFTNTNPVFLIIFFLGFTAFIARYIIKLLNKENFENKRITLLFSIIIPLVFGLVMFYSLVINPNASLCVDRYFIILLPFIIFFESYFIYSIFKAIKKYLKKELFLWIALGVFLVFVVPCGLYSSYYTALQYKYMVPNEWYRETAHYLVSSNDLDKDDVALLQFENTDAWLTYYVAKKGEYTIRNYYGDCFEEEVLKMVIDGEELNETISPEEFLEEIQTKNIIYLFYDHPVGINMNNNYIYNNLVENYDLEIVHYNFYKFTKRA